MCRSHPSPTVEPPFVFSRPGFRARAGFTLVELITVIVILGILAAFVAPRYFGMADEARKQEGLLVLADGAGHFNLACMKYVINRHEAPKTLVDIAGSDYLDLDGSGSVVVGDIQYTYSELSEMEVQITGAVLNSEGAWSVYTDLDGSTLTNTVAWP